MEDLIQKIIETATSVGASYADLRFDNIQSTRIQVRNDEVTSFRTLFEQGAGLRVLVDGAWGFTMSSDLKKLTSSVGKAVELAKQSASHRTERITVAEQQRFKGDVEWKQKKSHDTISVEDKLEFALEVNKRPRDLSKNIAMVDNVYFEEEMSRWFANSEGTSIKYSRPVTAASIRLVGKSGEITVLRGKALGGLAGLEAAPFDKFLQITEEETRNVLQLLKAKPAPSGDFPAVLNYDLGYLLVHEAFGHLCEGDAILQGDSILEGKIGEQVTSNLVTIIDDPTMKEASGIPAYGSYPFDDEGIKALPTTLVNKGRLVSYLHSRETASKLGQKVTGNARIENYKRLPLVRMSNIYFQPSTYSEEELFEDVKDGVYLVDARGGQTTGQGTFHVGVQMVYLIKKGEKGDLRKGTAIAGRTLDTLKKIDAIGKQISFDIGGCGKGDPEQMVRCGSNGPPIRVSSITVGG
jgi:TldD protein